jgi:hypothetical protein
MHKAAPVAALDTADELPNQLGLIETRAEL